jgi:hypothetical protein
MNSIATAARVAALPMEAKKDSLRQTQDGLWKVTFTVKSEDMHTAILNAPMGTRYMLAAVEIGDNEEPVKQPEKQLTAGERVKRHFEASCQDEIFMAWFIEWADGSVPADANPRDAVKAAMGIESANELLANPEPWNRLWTEYQYKDVVR